MLAKQALNLKRVTNDTGPTSAADAVKTTSSSSAGLPLGIAGAIVCVLGIVGGAVFFVHRHRQKYSVVHAWRGGGEGGAL